jgi:outer membrane protein
MNRIATAIVTSMLFVGGPAVSIATAQTTGTRPPAGATTTPPPSIPAIQTPSKPATPPPAQAPAPAPVVPFPDGAKVAFVNLQFIAQESIMGKAASAEMNTLRDKKAAEINSKNVQLKALQDKQASGGGLMNDAAKSQLAKDIDKLTMDIQYSNQTAQKELDDKNTDLMNEFIAKVQPVIEAYAKEKGIDVVLTQDSGAIYVRPGLDISSDIAKRLDGKK